MSDELQGRLEGMHERHCRWQSHLAVESEVHDHAAVVLSLVEEKSWVAVDECSLKHFESAPAAA